MRYRQNIQTYLNEAIRHKTEKKENQTWQLEYERWKTEQEKQMFEIEKRKFELENERLRSEIESQRNDAKELISTGMSFIDHTNSLSGDSAEMQKRSFLDLDEYKSN